MDTSTCGICREERGTLTWRTGNFLRSLEEEDFTVWYSVLVIINCHLDTTQSYLGERPTLNYLSGLAVDMSEGTASWCEKTLPMPTVHGHIDSETGN